MERSSSATEDSTSISSAPTTPSTSVGVLDFNQYAAESPKTSPARLPIFHFHSYGTSDDFAAQPSPPPVRKGEFPEGIFYIKSGLNGKVLDVRGGSRKPDTRIILWPQKFGTDRDNQLWFAVDSFIVNVGSRLCLDIRGSLVPDDLQLLAETRIIQYTRKSRVEAHNQRFGLSPDGYIYCLAHPNLVFDVRGESDRDGATLIIYPRKLAENGGAVKHQRWLCEPVSSSPPQHAPVRQNTNSLRRALTGSSLRDLLS